MAISAPFCKGDQLPKAVRKGWVYRKGAVFRLFRTLSNGTGFASWGRDFSALSLRDPTRANASKSLRPG